MNDFDAFAKTAVERLLGIIQLDPDKLTVDGITGANKDFKDVTANMDINLSKAKIKEIDGMIAEMNNVPGSAASFESVKSCIAYLNNAKQSMTAAREGAYNYQRMGNRFIEGITLRMRANASGNGVDFDKAQRMIKEAKNGMTNSQDADAYRNVKADLAKPTKTEPKKEEPNS
jgi:hypothetical protein